MKLAKILFSIMLGIVFLISVVSALQPIQFCAISGIVPSNVTMAIPYDGMIITEDTTFCPGEYYLPNGIKIRASNITLDCNGAELIGKYNDSFLVTGIGVQGYRNSILNCTIKNYTVGINLWGGNNSIKYNKLIDNYNTGLMMINSDYNYIYDNIIFNSNFYRSYFMTIGINLGGAPDSYYNIIEKNNLSGNGWGIDLGGGNNSIIDNDMHDNRYSINFRSDAEMNNITQNIFRNSWIRDISGSSNNNIWKNDFYTYGVLVGSLGTSNSYCTNCIGNNYFDGATGPVCPLTCFDEDNDGIPNDEDKCPNTEEEQIIYGCSCEQILGLKPGKGKFSKCSLGIIKVFSRGVGWAKNLF